MVAWLSTLLGLLIVRCYSCGGTPNRSWCRYPRRPRLRWPRPWRLARWRWRSGASSYCGQNHTGPRVQVDPKKRARMDKKNLNKRIKRQSQRDGSGWGASDWSIFHYEFVKCIGNTACMFPVLCACVQQLRFISTVCGSDMRRALAQHNTMQRCCYINCSTHLGLRVGCGPHLLN